MPAEAARLQRRLGARDRLCLLALAAVAAAGTLGGGLATAGGGAASPGSGCVSVVRAFVVGGATMTRCGRAAEALCRSSRAEADVAAGCREAGIRLRP